MIWDGIKTGLKTLFWAITALFWISSVSFFIKTMYLPYDQLDKHCIF